MNQQKNAAPLPGAWSALVLLLGINLFNYIDRQILAAVEPEIRATFFAPNDINAMAKTGTSATLFLSPTCCRRPLLGWLADRFSRGSLSASASFFGVSPAAHPVSPQLSPFCFARVFSSESAKADTAGCADNSGRSFPATKSRANAGHLLRRHSRGQRTWLCARRINRHASWMALGILSRHAAGLVAGSALFLHARSARSGVTIGENEGATWDRLSSALLGRRSYRFEHVRANGHDFCHWRLGFWMAGLSCNIAGNRVDRDHLWRDHRRCRLDFHAPRRIAGRSIARAFPGSYFLVSGLECYSRFLFRRMLYTPFPLAWIFVRCGFFCFLQYRSFQHCARQCFATQQCARPPSPSIFLSFISGRCRRFRRSVSSPGHTNHEHRVPCRLGVMLLSGIIWLAGMKYLERDTAAVENAVA